MHYSKAQRFWWLVYWLALTISFCIIGFLLVTRATGYRYNPHTSRYQKTGMLVFNNPPRDSILTIDGTTQILRGTTRLANVLPGTYRIRVEKNGYAPWEDVVTIEPGYVVSLDDITLFRKHPIVLPSEPYVALLPYYNVEDRRIRIVDGEVWHGTDLVTRFDVPPSNALLLNDQRHIIYLRGQELRVIDIHGQHDQLLYTRQSAEPEPFALIDGVLVLQDGSKVIALDID